MSAHSIRAVAKTASTGLYGDGGTAPPAGSRETFVDIVGFVRIDLRVPPPPVVYRLAVFDRFSEEAGAVVARAEQESRLLGHGQIGTEHLLLGLVAQKDSAPARALLDLGLTLGGCRSKVREALGPAPIEARAKARSVGEIGELLTDRARRALERADRLSIRRHDEDVQPVHVLLSVLDVEGRAGQILRGLSIDVASLHASVLLTMPTDIGSPASSEPDIARSPADHPEVVPRCGGCGATLEGSLSHRRVTSRDAEGRPRDFTVAFCSTCGVVFATGVE